MKSAGIPVGQGICRKPAQTMADFQGRVKSNPHCGSSLKKLQSAGLGKVAATAAGLLLGFSAVADTTITDFDMFNLDGLFGWADATIVSTTNYTITDIGYGSGYKDINPNIDASGEKTVEVMVRLSGPPGANGQLGPIVSLVDGDGTFYNYAWYGQTLGTHVLTANVNSPTFTSGAGSVPGLDLSALDFFHLQLDPGGFGSSGAYTVVWEGPPPHRSHRPGHHVPILQSKHSGVHAALVLAIRQELHHSAHVQPVRCFHSIGNGHTV